MDERPQFQTLSSRNEPSYHKLDVKLSERHVQETKSKLSWDVTITPNGVQSQKLGVLQGTNSGPGSS